MYSVLSRIYHDDVPTAWFSNHLSKASPCSFLEDEGVPDEDVKTASTIIMVSAVQLIGILLLIALLCLAKRIKAMQRFKLDDKPPPYQPPPSFKAAMKMSHEVS